MLTFLVELFIVYDDYLNKKDKYVKDNVDNLNYGLVNCGIDGKLVLSTLNVFKSRAIMPMIVYIITIPRSP